MSVVLFCSRWFCWFWLSWVDRFCCSTGFFKFWFLSIRFVNYFCFSFLFFGSDSSGFTGSDSQSVVLFVQQNRCCRRQLVLIHLVLIMSQFCLFWSSLVPLVHFIESRFFWFCLVMPKFCRSGPGPVCSQMDAAEVQCDLQRAAEPRTWFSVVLMAHNEQ